MPKIREYENPIQGLRVSNQDAAAAAAAGEAAARGEAESFGDLGGAVSRFGSTVAAMQKHRVQQEISKGAALVATLQDNLSSKWRDLAAKSDPNDASVTQTFRDKELTPALDKFYEGFETEEGRQWAEKVKNDLTQHFYDKTAADTATRSGQALVSNLGTFSNSLVTSVRNDPTSLDTNLKLVDTTIPAMVQSSSNLSPSVAGKVATDLVNKVKSELVKGAIQAAIDANPERGLQIAEGGKYREYLDNDDLQSFKQYAETVARIRKQEERSAAVEARRQQEEAGNDRAAQIIATTIRVGPDGSMFTSPDYYRQSLQLAKDGYKPSLVQSMIAAGRAIDNDNEKGQRAITDPTTYQDFAKRMYLPDGDPQRLTMEEVFTARAQGRLSNGDFAFYKDAISTSIKDPQKIEDQKELNKFFDGYKKFITKSTMMANDALGDQRYYEFMRDKQVQFEAARRTGLTPDQLLSPNSPNFIGRDIHRYQITVEQARQTTLQKVTTGVKPLPPVNAPDSKKWLPGESMEDYAKRLRGTP